MTRHGAQLEGVGARTRELGVTYAVEAVTADFGLGVHAVVGGRADGTSLLLQLLALQALPRSGTLRVLDQVIVGGARHRGLLPSARRAIAYLPREPRLASALRVDETLSLASAVRQEPAKDPRARLEVLGLAALASRRVSSLSRAEARAVSLAEALTSRAQLIVIDEPLVEIDPRAEAALVPRLREEERTAARTIVVVTSSLRDARAMAPAGRIQTLTRGTLSRGGLTLPRAPGGAIDTTPGAPGGPRGEPVQLRALLTHPRQVLATLASEPCIGDLRTEGEALVLEGLDPSAMAAALSRAVLATEGTLLSLDCDRLVLVAPPPSAGGERAP